MYNLYPFTQYNHTIYSCLFLLLNSSTIKQIIFKGNLLWDSPFINLVKLWTETWRRTYQFQMNSSILILRLIHVVISSDPWQQFSFLYVQRQWWCLPVICDRGNRPRSAGRIPALPRSDPAVVQPRCDKDMEGVSHDNFLSTEGQQIIQINNRLQILKALLSTKTIWLVSTDRYTDLKPIELLWEHHPLWLAGDLNLNHRTTH